MRLIFGYVALALLGSMLHADVYAVVNGEELTDRDVKPMLKMFYGSRSMSDLNENEKKMLIDQALEKKLITQQAKKDNLSQDPEFKKVVDDFKNRLLVEFWMKSKLDSINVSGKEVEAFFEKNRPNYPKDTKIESVKSDIEQKLKMQKFQILVDKTLSQMKQEAKIEYRK